MFFWCKASIHIFFSPPTLRYSENTFQVNLSVLPINDFSILRYGFQSILFFLPLLWNSSSWRSTRWKYFFNKCFFTHFWRSLYQVRDSYSIWEIDSIYLWYVFWNQSFPFWSPVHQVVSSSSFYRNLYLSALSFWWRFSDWHLINVSLLKFAFRLRNGSGSLRFSSFLNDCSVILYSYPCIRSFLQEIRFLSLPHIDGCNTTFPMDSPWPFHLFHPFHVAFIYYELNDFLLYFSCFLLMSI